MGQGCKGIALARWVTLAAVALTLAHCSKGPPSSKWGVSASPRVVEPGQPVPKGGGSYRVGKPYTVAGRTYTPEENAAYSAEGLASWYGEDFHGRLTANHEIYDMNAISAAHPTLPMPSYVRVTNLANGRSIVVRVNDRGPYHPGRVIDVSVRTAKLLGFYDSGTTRVRVDYVGRASLAGSDDNKLAATLRQGGTPRYADAHRSDGRPRYQDRPAYAVAESGRAPRSQQPASRVAVAGGGTAEREYFDPQPMTERRVLTGPRREAAPAPFDSRFAPASGVAVPPPAAPVSAYAPAMPRAEAVMTGRGLY
jgi:rare lipoprotein A